MSKRPRLTPLRTRINIQLPRRGDFLLPDGRRLVYWREYQSPHVIAGRLWRLAQAEGSALVITGSLDPTPTGPILHLSITGTESLVDWPTVLAVRDVLAPPPLTLMVALPRPIDLEKHMLHLFQVPPWRKS